MTHRKIWLRQPDSQLRLPNNFNEVIEEGYLPGTYDWITPISLIADLTQSPNVIAKLIFEYAGMLPTHLTFGNDFNQTIGVGVLPA